MRLPFHFNNLYRSLTPSAILLFLSLGFLFPVKAQTYPNSSLAASAITMRLAVSGGNHLPAGSTVAVVPFVHEDGTVSRFSRYFSSEMTNSVRKTGGFKPVERSRIEIILQEILLSYTGLVNSQKAIDIGKLQGAKALIVGEFKEKNNFLHVDCRMIEVASEKVLVESSTRIRITGSMKNMISVREPKPGNNAKPTSVAGVTFTPIEEDKNNATTTQNSEIQNQARLEKIHSEFTEDYFGGEGFRYKVRNVNIENKGNIYRGRKGQSVQVSMEILHNCSSCGQAWNQVIVGLGGENTAQVSVWNGGQRSGGAVQKIERPADPIFYQNHGEEPEWVRVFFEIRLPNTPGTYYLRSRYAQHFSGKLMLQETKDTAQEDDSKTLGWWRVDRPKGPDSETNIGAFILE